MRFPIPALLALTLVLTTPAEAAGVRAIEIPGAPTLNGIVWSPCAARGGRAQIRNRTIGGTSDCAVVGEKLPLVVMSHGRTGWAGTHRDLAATLADAGFIVAAVDHLLDSNSFDLRRVDDLAHLTDRPAEIRRLIDFMLETSPLAATIDRERTGFFGYSRGGYTGLVLLGGKPARELAEASCSGPFGPAALCEHIRRDGFPSAGFMADPRIKVAVIADPAPVFFFGRDQLTAVTTPIQLWASEHGGRGANANATRDIGNMLKNKTEVRIVQQGGHFVFTRPCSEDGKQKDPETCVDAPGFDRRAFHRQFNAEVLAFFRKHLVESGGR